MEEWFKEREEGIAQEFLEGEEWIEKVRKFDDDESIYE